MTNDVSIKHFNIATSYKTSLFLQMQSHPAAHITGTGQGTKWTVRNMPSPNNPGKLVPC